MVSKLQRSPRTKAPSEVNRRRLALTLSPETWLALDRLKRAGGVSPAQFVASIVEEARPVVTAVAESFEKARKSPQEALEVMRDLADRTLVTGAQVSLELDAARKRSKLRKARSA
jgi:hypothetical protein